jgi:CubicO group peptidase (beta-lactamase class C family)
MKPGVISFRTWSLKCSFILAAVIPALYSTSAPAQDKSKIIDSIFSFTRANAPGCVCAVARQGKTVFSHAYGSADLERGVPLTTNSVFDIGSAHKQFVAASVLLLAEEGKLSLADDIRKYLPELPDYGYKITVDHLLTHTGGLRDWTGLLPLSSANTKVLDLILRQRGLNFLPGEEWSYSNSGYVLAKEIVARISGTSFGTFAAKRLFEPLGMKATQYSVDMLDVIPNRAMAYEQQNGNWKISMRVDNNRGGGGIVSTAEDLLIWNDALTHQRLGKFVTQKLQEPARLNNGRVLKYARGLFIDPYRGGIPMVAHSGGAAGYSSWIGRFPEHDLSVAVLCNVEPISATSLAHRVADLFLPADVKDVEGDGPPPALPQGVDVSGKTGLYLEAQSGAPLYLVMERGFLRIANGPGLVAVSNDRFRRWGTALQFMSQDSFEINFRSPETFEMKSMEGKLTRYVKAKPYSYKPEELKEFTGAYESEEIGAVLKITADEKGLKLALTHSPGKTLQFEPIAPETFIWNKRMIIRFRRTQAGKIGSLEYTNPVIRNVTFTRSTKTS